MTKLTRTNVINAIEGCLGNYSTIAQKCGVNRQTVSEFFKRHPDLKELADQDREKLIDVAESQIAVAIKDGDVNSSWKLVEQQAKNRGYGNKINVDATVENKGEDYLKKVKEKFKDLPKEVQDQVISVIYD